MDWMKIYSKDSGCVLIQPPPSHLEPWYTQIHICIHETYEFIYEKIIWIHILYEFKHEFIHEFIYVNSYTYEFTQSIHIIIIWIHIWNDYMNSYTCEFICEMNIWIYEYTNSCVWIQMYRFWILVWIHKYMNSAILIHCIPFEFMNLISLTWIHDMNSLLKIDGNSTFWIHGIEFSNKIWHMNSLKWIQKNHNSYFRYEFIHEMNIYEFTNLISGEIWWFHIKMNSAAAQYNQPEHLWSNVSLVVQSRFQLHWERETVVLLPSQDQRVE